MYLVYSCYDSAGREYFFILNIACYVMARPALAKKAAANLLFYYYVCSGTGQEYRNIRRRPYQQWSSIYPWSGLVDPFVYKVTTPLDVK